jgi:hypothetical protein
MKSNQKILTGLLLIIFLLSFSTLVSAAGLWDSQVGLGGNDSTIKTQGFGGNPNNDPTLIVIKLIGTFLTFLGIIMVIIIIYAGFRWMTAGDNEKNITEAKQWLINSVIGLIIILSSYGITVYITKCAVMATNSHAHVWYCFQ